MSDTSDSSYDEYIVEKIVDKRVMKGGKVQFEIKWKDYPPEQNTWESKESLRNAQHLVDQFEAELNRRKQQMLRIRPEETGLDKGYIPEKVVGITNEGGTLRFLMRYKDLDEMELIPNDVARRKCPNLIIQFYEAHICFK